MTPYYQDQFVTIHLGDCRDVLPILGQFDLLLTDPPYGIGEGTRKKVTSRGRGSALTKGRVYVTDYGDADWDFSVIPVETMDLCRSKAAKQIIFGGNYYSLPPSRCWLVWDKENTGDFADAELAWTNLDKAVRLKRHMWNGMLRKGREARFHPTQKPVDVMAWALLQAGTVASVIDPFGGSGTTAVACKQSAIHCTLVEREERYCEIAANRLSQDALALEWSESGKEAA